VGPKGYSAVAGSFIVWGQAGDASVSGCSDCFTVNLNSPSVSNGSGILTGSGWTGSCVYEGGDAQLIDCTIIFSTPFCTSSSCPPSSLPTCTISSVSPIQATPDVGGVSPPAGGIDVYSVTGTGFSVEAQTWRAGNGSPGYKGPPQGYVWNVFGVAFSCIMSAL